MSAVTVKELAEYRLGRPALTGQDYEDADLMILGGCEVCGASIAAYNACPTKTGYWRCLNGCVDGVGYATAAEADEAIFGGGGAGDAA